MEKDPHRNPDGHIRSEGSILKDIKEVGARGYLLTHLSAESTAQNIRQLMKTNDKLGRLVFQIGGVLKNQGMDTDDAYALGIIHGIRLAERRMEEEDLDNLYNTESTKESDF